MKQEIQASHFFDLSNFAHRELFAEGKPVWEALERIANYLKAKGLRSIKESVPRGTFIENSDTIHLGTNVIIEPGAYVSGPCIIGNGTVIRHGAYIRGNVITGVDCVIGHATEIKNSIFLDRAKAPHFAYVGDSILGNDVNLGAGTKCANLKLNKSNVSVSVMGEKIETNRTKLGAVFGDGAQTGCNVVTNPGTLMGKRSTSAPCKSIHGYTPPDTHLTY